jgi:transposase
MEKAKLSKKRFKPILLANHDTIKQLLAWSRYFLYKNKSKWSKNQTERAEILFELYPNIKRAYDLAQDLRNIFEKTTDKVIGLSRLARWHEKVNQSGFKSFNTISRSIINHYQTILNYFDNRSTKASAESFNAKIKAFRSQFRGVRNIEFFLFRLTNIYA